MDKDERTRRWQELREKAQSRLGIGGDLMTPENDDSLDRVMLRTILGNQKAMLYALEHLLEGDDFYRDSIRRQRVQTDRVIEVARHANG